MGLIRASISVKSPVNTVVPVLDLAHDWQARAPNSPVIIVGTHYDVIRDKYPPSYCEDLQQLIRDRSVAVGE